MTVEEIYSEIASHLLKGIMIHEQLTNYYDFLNLKGYKRCHEYHFLCETLAYRKLCRYFVNHHNKLIPNVSIENPEVIPDSWYKYTKQDVDASTKKNAVRNGLVMWVDWETKTKRFYEEKYQQLMEIGEVASACNVKCLVRDVDKELKKCTRYLIDKETINYDMNAIIAEQRSKHDKYRRKIQKELAVHLC